MKDFLNTKVKAHEKYLHELRMTVTERDEYYWEAEYNRPKKVFSSEQLEAMHARDEENKRKNYNAFADERYWTPEYLEKKYADKEMKDFENM